MSPSINKSDNILSPHIDITKFYSEKTLILKNLKMSEHCEEKNRLD